MASKLRLKDRLKNLIQPDETESEDRFIFFWDDIYLDEDDITETITETEKSLPVFPIYFVNILMFLLAGAIIFGGISGNSLVVVISGLFLLVLLIANLAIFNRRYLSVLQKVDSQSRKFKDLDMRGADFISELEENQSIINLEDMRKKISTIVNDVNQLLNKSNYQLAIIERNFARTSSSLGHANISLDQSIGNVAQYQEYKGYLSLASTGVDSLTNTFDDSISVTYDVIKLLKSLGKQIQMLALNAGIEASRSEGGLGDCFEVVASNLRRLSHHVMDSASEVKSKLADIGENARESLEMITSSMQVLGEKLDQSHSTISNVTDSIASSSNYFNNVQSNYDDLLKDIREMEEKLKSFTL